jgi:hypothetical protein
MRPQRSTAAAITAARVASRVTSAAKATHSPPSCRASAAVASAAASSRSTGENARALLGETQHGGAAVADPLAGALPGADHDRDLAVEPHWHRRTQAEVSGP